MDNKYWLAPHSLFHSSRLAQLRNPIHFRGEREPSSATRQQACPDHIELLQHSYAIRSTPFHHTHSRSSKHAGVPRLVVYVRKAPCTNTLFELTSTSSPQRTCCARHTHSRSSKHAGVPRLTVHLMANLAQSRRLAECPCKMSSTFAPQQAFTLTRLEKDACIRRRSLWAIGSVTVYIVRPCRGHSRPRKHLALLENVAVGLASSAAPTHEWQFVLW